MIRRFLPREYSFYDSFQKAAANTLEAAELLRTMMDDPSQREPLAIAIKELEVKGDDILHETVAELNKTFLTPFDREDIHGLIGRLDDILDGIEGIAARMVIFDIRQVKPLMVQITDTLVRSAKVLVDLLKVFRNLASSADIFALCVEVNRLENEGDELLRKGLLELMRGTPDPLEVIKWKELYELVEMTIDRCEDVANIVEGVVVKNA